MNYLWKSMDYLASDDKLKFGLGPVLAYVVGFSLVTLPLEIIIRKASPQLSSSKSFIVYNTESRTRMEARAKTEEKVPLFGLNLKSQVGLALWNLIGLPSIVNGIFSYFLMTSPYLVDINKKVDTYPGGDHWDWKVFITSFLLLQLIGDFFLYWGHRIQHEFECLWKLHSVHHTLDSPTPIGTLYIDPIDATLQGALPMMIAILIMQPDLFTTYLYIALRVGENAVNHSGIDSWIFDIVTLKCLPFRASIAHHDSHHKLSKHAMGAKNYGENFWVWDYLFGTWKDYSAIHLAAEKKEAEILRRIFTTTSYDHKDNIDISRDDNSNNNNEANTTNNYDDGEKLRRTRPSKSSAKGKSPVKKGKSPVKSKSPSRAR